MKNNPRELAVEALTRVFKNKAYSNIEINNILKDSDMSDADKRLMTNIVYGVIQHKYVLEYQLEPYLKDKKLDLWLDLLLQTAIYQLSYLDKIPEHAVLNESTEIAKQKANRGAGNLVNAVLRNFQRHGARKMSGKDTVYDLSKFYSVPRWLVQLFIDQQGLAKTKEILKSINQPSHVSIRVNTNKTTVADLQKTLQNKGFDVKPSKISSVGLICESGNLVNTDEFREGLYTVQDESSMLVAPALDLQPDSRVLDACAAPGGKTTHIASYIKNGEVTALDIHKHKTKLIRDNSQRMGYSDIISTGAIDARKAKDVLNTTFDRILVDAPCSGLGLIRRKPELRYFRQEEDLLNLQRVQLQILDSMVDLLEVNGKLVFSTCTFDDEENETVVKKFLADHKNFELEPVKHEAVMDKSVKDGMLKVLPSDYFTDGFFIATFVRKN
ncbi:16S rRNA (cytosine(967)-C(5))-methyltransferase RsmB [Companilactobacillus futsaii]|uniref:16S rRNA (cytosine(967)-C(5))-methyltransferase n=2 Tax=Companilactobacillus futsaii TaxID=938155 RepID=A0A5B7T2V8_9LACO|nr:16S rRNA (cytosine(967)-C(5))-methyltransferase RsmB [Companilactobacillus futsaii]KRK91482.1 16S rRNA methyltransferase B [Companilactobacillus futsaii JCM 17355]QCX24481.1 16S rRNA (cytosine(967)-C(5))-methyltransferase RsmB [Companilactobacillus futsaii]